MCDKECLKTIDLSNGYRVAYVEYGDPRGRPMFYFHGWPSSKTQARLVDAIARELGIRIISLDRPGLGWSALQAERSFADFAHGVLEVADTLGIDRFAVLGVSGGGPYALSCGAHGGERVERVGICCGVPQLNKIHDRKQWFWPYRLLALMEEKFPTLLRPLLELLSLPIRTMAWSGWVRCLLGCLPAVDRAAILTGDRLPVVYTSVRHGMRQGVAGILIDGLLYLRPWGFDLGDINCPVSFWHGALDRNIPLDFVRKTVSRIQHAKLQVYEEEGHYSLPLNQAETILKYFVTSNIEHQTSKVERV